MRPPVTIATTGAAALSLAENRGEIEDAIRDLWGADVSLDASTPLAGIIGINALRDTQIAEAIVSLSQMLDPLTAAGVFLRALGAAIGMAPIPATRSHVVATLAGVAGTNIPAGSRASTTDGVIFATLASATLASGGSPVAMQAIEDGPLEAAAATLTMIVTVVPGWETILNAGAAVPGRAAQTDAEFRAQYAARTGRLASGTVPAMLAAVTEAGATRTRIEENRTAVARVVQQWTLDPHSVLVLAQGGVAEDLERAIEARRGAGGATMTAIRSGTPNNSTLNGVSNGTVTWDGTAYPGLNLSSAGTSAQKAAALATLIDGIAVSYIDDRYQVFYGWVPGTQPVFGSGAVETAFGLAPALAVASEGPFARPRTRNLTVDATITQQMLFPSDGMERIRAALEERAGAYQIGEQVWLNDFLSAAESVPGTRVTALSVQHAAADISGVAVPLDVLWALPRSGITLTVTTP